VDESYRGYTIRISCGAIWHAVLVEAATGIVLPTKATARLREGHIVALKRAQELVDLYCRALETA